MQVNSTEAILNAVQPIPDEGEDAFLFAVIAILAGCICEFSPLSPVLILIVGAASEFLASFFNLGRFSNSFTIWLSASPPEILLYGFLPPLLFESAVGLDYHIFKRLAVHATSYAVIIVVATTAIVSPAMLYILNLASIGWTWQHAALFVSLIASTDALAVSSVLKRCGGPENLLVLMESESLLNDASSLVLFTVFLDAVRDLPSHQNAASSLQDMSSGVMDILPGMLSKAGYLSIGGAVIGLALGVLTLALLRWLRSSGYHGVQQDLGILLAISYFAFYAANVNGFSGVIAVVVLGLYGAATSKFELAHSSAESNVDAIQGTIAGSLNSIVFFLAGASAMDFLTNTLPILHVYGTWMDLLAIPFIYLVMMMARGVTIVAVNCILQYFGCTSEISMQSVPFLVMGGLRGALSLVMAMVVSAEDVGNIGEKDALNNNGKAGSEQDELIRAQMLAWTSCFVLCTLCFNAPASPALLRWCGLLTVPEPKLKLRKKAQNALVRRWQETLEELRNNDDELLTAVDWDAVKSYTSPNNPNAHVGILRGAALSTSRLGAAISRRSTTLNSSELTKALLTSVTVLSEDDDLQTTAYKAPESAGIRTKGGDALTVHDMETPFVMAAGEGQFSKNSHSSLVPNQGNVAVVSLDMRLDDTTPAGDSPQHTMPMGSSPMDALRMTNSDLHEFGLDDNDDGEGVRDLLVEARIRWIAGLKRYAFRKRAEGLLSPSGARMLGTAFDEAMLHADRRLSIWKDIQTSAANRFVRLLVLISHNSRRASYAMPAVIRRPAVATVNFLTNWMTGILSKAMLRTSEVAVTYYMACTLSNQVMWLQQAMPASPLHSELAAEIHIVSNFIKNRELEAPSLFQGVQMYRAAMALLRRQINFVEEMYKAGVVDEHEHASMERPITTKIKALEAAGPIGRAHSTWTVLRQISFLKPLPDHVLQRIVDNGSVRILQDGDHVWGPADESNLVGSSSSVSEQHDTRNALAVVLRGLVSQNSAGRAGSSPIAKQYVGSGGVLGLVSAVTRRRASLFKTDAPSSTSDQKSVLWSAVASTSALQKGVLVFYLPDKEVDHAREEAARGDQLFKDMILQMYREAAIDVLDAQRSDVLHMLCQEWTRTQNARNTAEEGSSSGAEPVGSSSSSFFDAKSPKAWMVASQHAQNVLFALRRELRLGATVLELDPYTRYTQQSHCILLAGQAQVEMQHPNTNNGAVPPKKSFSFSLTRAAFEHKERKIEMPPPTLVSGPAVLLLPSAMSLQRQQNDIIDGGGGDQSTAKHSLAVPTLLAGHQGAVLVVCPVLKQTSAVTLDSIDFE